jgi:2-polyprenyl-3-methyl-5-hydroxy-6-metoxy-1,4-benzoquinol methylase
MEPPHLGCYVDLGARNACVSTILAHIEQRMAETAPSSIALEVVPTQAGYDRWAEIYDGEDNPLVLLEEELFPSLLGDVSGLSIADIGCGTGRHALPWAAAGARVTAVDFSEGMLEKARAKPGAETIRFLCHDLSKPFPLESHAFARVCCCLVLDHISDPEAFFSELARLCRPDGFIAISVMHPAMMLKGVQARFTDPATGRKIGPASHPNQISDYVRATVGAGLAVQHISEHAVDAALMARSPRAEKYLGWPLLFLMKLTPTR